MTTRIGGAVFKGGFVHPETERALRILVELDAEAEIVRDRRRQVKDECKHYDYDLEYIETMGYDQTPARICVVCRMPGYDVTEEDKRKLYAERCEDIEIPFTEADYERHKNGFNF